MREEVDIEGLVDNGLLDIEEVFDDADWSHVEEIASYITYVYGNNGDEPNIVRIMLQSATSYGITGYRWASDDGADGIMEVGSILLERDDAVEEGERLAKDLDEEQDAEEIYQQIAETGYFGSAEVNDIEYLCNEATKHSTGYLLITPDWDYPIGTRWTTNGYLQCDHVKLNANYPRPCFAAHALLKAIIQFQDSQES